MLLIYLLVLTAWDLKEKMVPVFLLAVGLVSAGGYALYLSCSGQGLWFQPLLGMIPGICLLLIALLTGKAGYADGLVLLIIGMLETYRVSLFVLCMGLFLTSLVSVALLLLRKVKRQTAIPFIPFLTVAYCVKEVLLL